MAEITVERRQTTSSGSPSVIAMDDAAVDVATAHVHEGIRALLADEVPDLAQRKGLAVFNDPYLHLSYQSFKSYLNFIFVTWSGVAVSLGHLLTRQISTHIFLVACVNADPRTQSLSTLSPSSFSRPWSAAS